VEICTISEARANLFQLVDNVAKWHEPVYIIGKRDKDGNRKKAVLVSEEDYSNMADTIYLSSIPGMRESILKSMKEPIENFSETLEWDDGDEK
jgi:antitoxin YefM